MSIQGLASTAREAYSLGSNQEEKLKKACQDFEAMFIDQMYKTMRKTTLDGGLIKKNAGEIMFTEMLDTEMANVAAADSKNGLGAMLFEQMQKLLPDSKNGNNYHPNTGTETKNPYNQGNFGNKNTKSNGIDLAI
jgi:flagellar protein FlgJ